MKPNYRKIGDYIRLVDIRNKDLKVKTLLGLSISKKFIPSVANTVGTNMKNYKIIRKNQFACSIMQVRRDKKMPVALLKNLDEAIISQAYPVFEIIDTKKLLPEYLMMWFSRSEFDRHACFLAVGGVRGSLEWEDFLNMKLPVPEIKKQEEIVKEYNTVVNRMKLNEKLNQKLEETAQAIYKHWFVDCNNLEKNTKLKLRDIIIHSKETILPNKLPNKIFNHYSIPAYDTTGLPIKEKSETIRSIKYLIKDNVILISKLNPSFSRVWNLFGKKENNAVCSTEFQVLIPKNNLFFGYVYFLLKTNKTIEYLSSLATGTSNSHQRVKPQEILEMRLNNFNKIKVEKYNNISAPILMKIRQNKKVNSKLIEFKNILLSIMGKG